MISSEVQRTLVKSPPELWAEISDPEALGRHLGELGAIRITRSKPEELVEWESDSASGTISIRASGWGTRVTLTAARPLPAADELAEDGPAAAGTAAHAEPETQAPTETHAQPDTQAPTETHAPGPPGPVAFAEPDAAAGAAPQLPPATPAGAMSTWAQQEAQSFEEPAAISTPGEPVVSGERPQTPDGVHAESPVEGAEAMLERRGFFARLFGRRSRPKPVSGTPIGVTSDTELRIAREAARRRLEATLAMPASPPHATPAEPAGAGADDEAPEAPALEASPEAPALDPSPGLMAEPDLTPRPAGRDAPEEDAAVVEVVAAEPHATQLGASEAAVVVTAAPLLAESAAPVPAEPANDLSTELRAAEETAAEEVRAVLTAVLDRLGAAHHRPFSRG